MKELLVSMERSGERIPVGSIRGEDLALVIATLNKFPVLLRNPTVPAGALSVTTQEKTIRSRSSP